MTPEQIEAKAQEWYPTPDESLRKFYAYKQAFKEQEDLRFAVERGYNFRQPELDTLQKENDRLRGRVRELEERENVISVFLKALSEGLFYISPNGRQKATQLLTKPDSTGGGEKEVC